MAAARACVVCVVRLVVYLGTTKGRDREVRVERLLCGENILSRRYSSRKKGPTSRREHNAGFRGGGESELRSGTGTGLGGREQISGKQGQRRRIEASTTASTAPAPAMQPEATGAREKKKTGQPGQCSESGVVRYVAASAKLRRAPALCLGPGTGTWCSRRGRVPCPRWN